MTFPLKKSGYIVRQGQRMLSVPAARFGFGPSRCKATLVTGHGVLGLQSSSSSVAPYTTYGAKLAVGTQYGPTQIHWACLKLRHRRDDRAGTTILYHIRNYHRTHSQLVVTTGRTELLEDRTAAASAGAAGPFTGRDYGPDGAAGGSRWSTPRTA